MTNVPKKKAEESIYRTLEEAVFSGGSLAGPVDYVMQSGDPNELFNNRVGGRIALLHYMVMAKSKPGIEVMLDIGADPNVRSSDGQTPLEIAIIQGNLEFVQLLVDKGADVNARGSYQGSTVRHSRRLCSTITQKLPNICWLMVQTRTFAMILASRLVR